MKRPIASALLALLGAALLAVSAGAHDHYAAGVIETDESGAAIPGAPLHLLGDDGLPLPLQAGGIYAKTFHMLARPAGFRTTPPIQLCGGYYVLDERPRSLFPLDSFSFTAISSLEPGGAHPGAWIHMEIISVSGPAGAQFGFWDENRSAGHDTPSASFATNQPPGAGSRFVLSWGGDLADEDPEGHIHNRSWTADKPGTYLVGFRLLDLSTNRPGGQPWHAPSQIYYFRFEAGPAFQPAAQLIPGTGCVLTWPSMMGTWNTASQPGITFSIERTPSLSLPDWQPIGSVVGTTAATATFTDAAPPTGRAFYRLIYLWGPP